MNNVNVYPFELEPLMYEYNAMEPYIDRETMMIHHDKHLKAYVDNLNKTLEPYKEYHNWSLEKLLCNICFLPRKIQQPIINYAGGVYNHNLYFDLLKNVGDNNRPIGRLAEKIDLSYGSYDKFYEMFKKAALDQFGSGYAWLVLDKNKNLNIIKTNNQNSSLILNLYPIILIDVWEHAYYLKYRNERIKYIENFRNIIDWGMAEKRYENYIKNSQENSK